VEEQVEKTKKRQEKLKKIILKEAQENRRRKEVEEKLREEMGALPEPTPIKPDISPEEEERQEKV